MFSMGYDDLAQAEAELVHHQNIAPERSPARLDYQSWTGRATAVGAPVDATSTGDRRGIAVQNPLNGDGRDSNNCSLSRFGTGPGPLRSPMYIALSALSLNDGQRGRPGALGLPL
jgi:hypothetical protein